MKTRKNVLELVRSAVVVALATGVCVASAAETPARPESVDDATPVRVERVKPKKEKQVTLRFLKENRDFIRASLDRLRSKPLAQSDGATAIDPRFLEYQRMITAILAAQDSAARTRETQDRRELLASVTELGRLESELDGLERLLADQRGRLGVLQEDFTGRQQTALAIVLTGHAAGVELTQLSFRIEDGTTFTAVLTPEQRESLRQGGAVQVYHELVEPREQVVEVALTTGGGPAGAPGYVTLEPSRNRLMLLRLDLSGLRSDQGVGSIQASTRLHDAHVPSTGG